MCGRFDVGGTGGTQSCCVDGRWARRVNTHLGRGDEPSPEVSVCVCVSGNLQRELDRRRLSLPFKGLFVSTVVFHTP